MNYYNLLNLPVDATPAEIRAAYFEAAKRFHPDINPDKGAEKTFTQSKEAYEVLSVPEKREAYNRSLPPGTLKQAEINLKAYFSKTGIPKMDEPQLFYALLDMECSRPLEDTDLPPIHVCLVIDRSTSMAGERMDMVRANIVDLLGKMRQKDTLGIVTFSDRAEVVVPPAAITEPYLIKNSLFNIQTNGATEIFRGMEAGYEVMRRSTLDNESKHLILITDGHTYGDEEACMELAAKAWSEGFSISSFGIGHEWNDSFLDRLSSAGGGNAIFVKNGSDLSRYIEQKMKAFNISYAHKVEFRFEVPENVELRYLFKILPEVAPLSTESPAPLGAIGFGNKTSLILEFKVPPVPKDVSDFDLIRGKILMEVPSNPIPYSRYFVNLSLPIKDHNLGEKPPTNILQAMSRLTLYRLQEKAQTEVKGGNYHQAARHLQYLATHLLSQGDRDLARTVLMEAEHIQRTHQFSKEGDKKIKYGTRSLLMLPEPEGNDS